MATFEPVNMFLAFLVIQKSTFLHNACLSYSKSKSMSLEDQEKRAALVAEREKAAELREEINKVRGQQASEATEMKDLKKTKKNKIERKKV